MTTSRVRAFIERSDACLTLCVGQRDILESLIAFARHKEHLAIEEAREQGVELVIEDD